MDRVRESERVADVVRTRRLGLRPLTLDDLDFLARMLGDPRVMRHYPRVLDRAGAREWLERQQDRYARDGFGLWLAERLDDGAPVGQIGCVTQEVAGRPVIEVGYLLEPASWGRGLATEGAAGARDHAFAALGAEFVVSLIRPVNAPSRAVAERLGMRLAGTTEHHGYQHDVFRADRPRAV